MTISKYCLPVVYQGSFPMTVGKYCLPWCISRLYSYDNQWIPFTIRAIWQWMLTYNLRRCVSHDNQWCLLLYLPRLFSYKMYGCRVFWCLIWHLQKAPYFNQNSYSYVLLYIRVIPKWHIAGAYHLVTCIFPKLVIYHILFTKQWVVAQAWICKLFTCSNFSILCCQKSSRVWAK